MSKYIQLGFRKKYPPLAIAIFSTSILGILRAEDSNAAISQTMKTVAFDPTFLNTDDEKTVDLSRFAYGSSGIPGVYKTAMYVNDQFINKKDIELRARNDKSIYPCLSTEVLKSITFNYDKLPDNFLTRVTSKAVLIFNNICQKRKLIMIVMSNGWILSFHSSIC